MDACAEEWAKSVFGMTASHPAGKNQDGSPRKDLWPPPEGCAPAPPERKNPLTKLLIDVSETHTSLLEDILQLTNRINLHKCSDYRLLMPRSKHSKIKQCRMEFGDEEKP